MAKLEIEKILISEDEIITRCQELGKTISEEYQDKEPVLIGLLKGSVPFMAELMKNITCDIRIEFMGLSSYAGTESLGDVKITKDLDCSIKGLDVIVVEDIIDTGLTIKKAKEILYTKGAKSVKVVSLLDKPSRRIIPVEIDYVGFEIPNEFVVGFGLDYDQKLRNLPYIGILSPKSYKE